MFLLAAISSPLAQRLADQHQSNEANTEPGVMRVVGRIRIKLINDSCKIGVCDLFIWQIHPYRRSSDKTLADSNFAEAPAELSIDVFEALFSELVSLFGNITNLVPEFRPSCRSLPHFCTDFCTGFANFCRAAHYFRGPRLHQKTGLLRRDLNQRQQNHPVQN